MLKLLVAVCLVALSQAVRRDCCTPGDKAAVQEQWNRLWNAQESGRIKTILGHVLFEKLFEVDPDSKELFKRVNVDDTKSPQFQAHTVRVLNGLDIIINLLQDPEAAKEALAHLGKQHEEREGIRASHFAEFGEIMLEGLNNLIPNFAYDSWKSCFSRVAQGITQNLPA